MFCTLPTFNVSLICIVPCTVCVHTHTPHARLTLSHGILSLQDTQMILGDPLLHTKDTLRHLHQCKGEIIAARRTTGCKMGWEVPQNSIHLLCVQGTGAYGEVYSGTMDGKEVTVKLLQHMTVKKLRDQFSGEIEVLRWVGGWVGGEGVVVLRGWGGCCGAEGVGRVLWC